MPGNVPALLGGFVYSSVLKIASKNKNNSIKAELVVSNINISVMSYHIKHRSLSRHISEAPPSRLVGNNL